jgi:hypothetical protein
VAPLNDAISTFNSTERRSGKTVINVRPSEQPAKADVTKDMVSIGN